VCPRAPPHTHREDPFFFKKRKKRVSVVIRVVWFIPTFGNVSFCEATNYTKPPTNENFAKISDFGLPHLHSLVCVDRVKLRFEQVMGILFEIERLRVHCSPTRSASIVGQMHTQ
jgi:hypothetical protein